MTLYVSQQPDPVLKSRNPSYEKPAEQSTGGYTACFASPSATVTERAHRARCGSPEDARTNGCRSVTEAEGAGSQQFRPGSSYRSSARERTSSGAGGWSKPLACQCVIPPLQPSGSQAPREHSSATAVCFPTPGSQNHWVFLLISPCFSMFWKPGFTCISPVLLDLLQTVLLWGMKGMYLFGSSGNMGGNC